MKEKKIPLRRCVVSGDRCPKQELIRVVRTPEGNVIVDLTSKANGRGAYLKKDISIINKAMKSKILEKHLEVEIPQSIYDELLKLAQNE